jgi:membrane protein implicated in regulation of membrane protease activity
VILVGALLLAVFVLSPPWSYAVIAGAVAVELVEVVVFVRWSQRRRVQMGAETLVGETGVVVDPLRPEGRVRVQGELWRARCAGEALPGDRVRVRALDGLVLEVERL